MTEVFGRMTAQTTSAAELRRTHPELGSEAFASCQAGWLFGRGPGVRVRARLLAGRLDRRLAAAASPADSALLAARAAELTGPDSRRTLAEAVERLARSADEAWSSAHIGPHRRAVGANRERLEAMSGLLRGPEPVYARGVAMLRLLLRDGSGPVYLDRGGATLAASLDRVQTAMRR